MLVKPLGGALSQARAKHLLGEHVDLGGVANTRASSWNRAPIDRMANLNIEAGTSTLDAMIASVERGVLMRTNVSWSIDDSRNKFQFGCEWGRLIENGKLTTVVKNPNYRGVSATFWRSLKAVGDDGTLRGHGHAVLRQGRADAGDPRRPCVAGLPVRRRRRLRRRRCGMSALPASRRAALSDAGGMPRLDAESYFGDLAAGLPKLLQADEQFMCSYAAEQSDFVRFNHARIRQAGHVDQAYLSLRLCTTRADGQRQASISLTLSGDVADDLAHCERALASLRSALPDLPPDPLLTIETEGFTSRNVRVGRLPSGVDMAATVTELGVGHDLVGFLATGPVQRGFASSYGHHNWHEVANFNFEWSLYYEADKAAKSSYAGFEWDAAGAAREDHPRRQRRGGAAPARPADRSGRVPGLPVADGDGRTRRR